MLCPRGKLRQLACCRDHRDLPRGLQLVGQAINGLAKQAQVDAAGSILHVAVCNGSDALAVSEGAAKLLASGVDLLGDMADDSFSSMELIGAEGHNSTATPKQIAQVRAHATQATALRPSSVMRQASSFKPSILHARDAVYWGYLAIVMLKPHVAADIGLCQICSGTGLHVLKNLPCFAVALAGGGCCCPGRNDAAVRDEGRHHQCPGCCCADARAQWLHLGR